MPAVVRAPPEKVRINSVLLVLGTAEMVIPLKVAPLGSVRVISAVVKVEGWMDSLNLMRKPVIAPASRPIALEVVIFAPVISGRLVPVPVSTTSKMVTVRVWVEKPEESVARMVTI